MYAYAVENQRKNWFTGVRHTRNQQKQLILSIGDKNQHEKIKVQEGAYEDRVTGKSKNRHW